MLRVLQNVAAYDHLVGSIGEVPHIVDTLVELLQVRTHNTPWLLTGPALATLLPPSASQ